MKRKKKIGTPEERAARRACTEAPIRSASGHLDADHGRAWSQEAALCSLTQQQPQARRGPKSWPPSNPYLDTLDKPARQRHRAACSSTSASDLAIPAARASARSSARERRADAEPLVLVGHLEGDLRARPVADEARDRDRASVALEVADEHVPRRVDGGEVVELGRARAAASGR